MSCDVPQPASLFKILRVALFYLFRPVISGLHIPNDWYPFNFTWPKVYSLLHIMSGFKKIHIFMLLKQQLIYLNDLATDFHSVYS